MFSTPCSPQQQVQPREPRLHTGAPAALQGPGPEGTRPSRPALKAPFPALCSQSRMWGETRAGGKEGTPQSRRNQRCWTGNGDPWLPPPSRTAQTRGQSGGLAPAHHTSSSRGAGRWEREGRRPLPGRRQGLANHQGPPDRAAECAPRGDAALWWRKRVRAGRCACLVLSRARWRGPGWCFPLVVGSLTKPGEAWVSRAKKAKHLPLGRVPHPSRSARRFRFGGGSLTCAPQGKESCLQGTESRSACFPECCLIQRCYPQSRVSI